jgi:carboxypeptidase C (cathepsin A)
MDHMDLTPELRENIVFEYYEAGHMMYVHEPSLVKFKKDLAGFVRGSY